MIIYQIHVDAEEGVDAYSIYDGEMHQVAVIHALSSGKWAVCTGVNAVKPEATPAKMETKVYQFFRDALSHLTYWMAEQSLFELLEQA